MNRREFFERLSGAMFALGTSLPGVRFLEGSTGWKLASQPLAAGDPKSGAELARTVAGPVKYPGPGATWQGYLARPATAGPHAAVVLIHSKRGLDQQVCELARHYASQGLVALAVDPLSRQGGTASLASPEAVRDALRILPETRNRADVDASVRYLQTHVSARNTRIEILVIGRDVTCSRASLK